MRLHESSLNRRDFLDGLAAAGLVAWTGVGGEMVLGYLTGREIPEPTEPQRVPDEALEALARDKFVLVPYGPGAVMIFQPPDGELQALSAICTHGQCNVHYRPEENDIFCGCHDGRFDANGINVEGPPPRPLRKFYIREENDGTLFVFHQTFEEHLTPDAEEPPEPAV